jgi:hypothetical protein
MEAWYNICVSNGTDGPAAEVMKEEIAEKLEEKRVLADLGAVWSADAMAECLSVPTSGSSN